MKISINGLSVYYEVQGKGAPILLLHGWGVDSGSLRPVSNLLKEQTESRVTALDFPGFGYSDGLSAAWCVQDYVQFLLAFMDELKVERAVLLGHSFGGRVAIKLAAQHPQRVDRLILVDSAGIKPPRTPAYYLRVAAAKTLNLTGRTFPGLQQTALFKKAQSGLGSADYRRAGALRSTFVRVVNEDLRACLPLIHSPTLLIWGEKDRETPLSDARIMRDTIPGARLEVIPGAGHFSYLDNFAAFSELLLGFLRGAH